VQIDFDSEELEQPDGASMGWHDARTYPTPACSKQDFWQRPPRPLIIWWVRRCCGARRCSNTALPSQDAALRLTRPRANFIFLRLF